MGAHLLYVDPGGFKPVDIAEFVKERLARHGEEPDAMFHITLHLKNESGINNNHEVTQFKFIPLYSKFRKLTDICDENSL